MNRTKILILGFLLTMNILADECDDCQKPGAIGRLIASVQKFIDPTFGMSKAEGMSICLINPDLNPHDGGPGHRWIEISKNESYGWWAGDKFSKNLELSDIGMVVSGELNGQSMYGGSVTQDPKHGDRPDGILVYDVYIPKDKTVDEVTSKIREFSQNYKGKWGRPGGPNGHQFIKEIMEKFGLEIKRRKER